MYDREHTLNGTEGNTVDVVRIDESWMGQKVPYEITVSAEDPRVNTTFSTADAEQFAEDWGENDCFSLHFDVNSESVQPALGAINDCPSPSSASVARNSTTDSRR
jgi:hypothetical protein